MQCRRVLLFLAGASLACATPAVAQDRQPLPATTTLQFESWRATAFSDANTPPMSLVATSPDRTRHALVGGAIGAAAGIVACTAISTLANDSADGGLSFCPLDTYLLIGGAGFLVGGVIGWLS